MTFVVPRLDRDTAVERIMKWKQLPLPEITAAMPDLTPVVTYSPVGGARIDHAALQSLRDTMLQLAREHGMPHAPRQVATFEGIGARLMNERLPMTPHEASQDDVWTYVTVCWLFDIAVWRFGADASNDRYIGHLNRNTFRRMWWRAAVLGPEVDLTRLGEDELVNIMERPTLASDRRLARYIAIEFLERIERDSVDERMRLMREATKRLLRLTPFVAFPALADGELRVVVADAFDAAAAGLAGATATMPPRKRAVAPIASAEVTGIRTMIIAAPDSKEESPRASAARAGDFEEVAQAALDIARRTGRVTNMSLRELAPITSDEARDVFQALMDRGQLVRRGVKRGTHYVLPETPPNQAARVNPLGPKPETPPHRGPAATPSRPQRSTETALRRLLRRAR